MATGGSANLTADDFRDICGLCMESYSGRTPKMLPCFHTFCQICLMSLAERASTTGPENNERDEKESPVAELAEGETADEETDADHDTQSEGEAVEEGKDADSSDRQSDDTHDKEQDNTGGKLKKKKFLCPTCRAPVTVPRHGVSALQTNFYLNIEASPARDPQPSSSSSSPVMCEMCEEGEQQEADHTCHTCQQHMCRSCRRLHDLVKGARDHRVESMAAQPAARSGMPGTSSKKCQYHPGQALCFQCCKCDVAVCLHCKLTSHEGHETEDMATAALHAKEELMGMQIKGNKQLYLLEAGIRRLERNEQDLKHQQQEVVQQVASRYDTLMAWAARGRDEVLEALTVKVQLALNDIHSRKAAASIVRDNISSMMGRSQFYRKLSGPDIVLMKNELQAALLSQDKMTDYQAQGERTENLTFFTCNADSSVIELDTLRVYIGQLIGEGEGVSGDRPVVSLRDLPKLFAQLETEMKSVKAITDKCQAEKVSFHVKMSGTTSISANTNVVFNQVMHDNGNGYSNSTGIFTAPETGTYMFMTTVRHNTNGNNCVVYLYVNGVNWGQTDTPDSSTAHIVARLNKGEQVYVRSANNFQCRANVSMFSGAMIS